MGFRELVNEFSWSKSRHGKFEECRRLYWFHYYGAWGGWEASAAPETREAYILKNLSTRQQWAGKVVHDVIAYALTLARAGDPPPLNQLIARAHRRMREDFRRSRSGEYRARPKRVVGLVEHELGLPVSDAEWKANWDAAESCLRTFYASRWLARARTLAREDWLPIDEIDSFQLDGIRVFAGPDFAFREEGTTVLVDWKTGRPRDEDREQVKGYALFAAAKWGAAPERVLARLVYLGSGEEIDVNVTPAALEEFRAFFRASVSSMKALLRDPERNLAVKDDFPMPEDPSRCRGCCFQRLCGRAEAR
ncbi:MAG: PD-(D/E)XK nuclease family protein [Myxococcales bacterium]|jgi:CRISPR/Cas system-associated exonuclease Cas4 (RecB family)